MRFKEISLNPAKAFSSGFDKASNAVDKAFSPKQWGKGSGASEPSSSSATLSSPTITLEKHQIRDAEGIMQAVLKGNVSVLTRQQTELARDFLEQIQKL
jgi:hypothetical protein